MTDKLFVYGTLAPGRPNEHILAPIAGTWQPATVTGKLYQNGWGAALGYPGIVIDSQGDKVEGLIFSSDKLPDNWSMFDEFEGEGYQRVTVTVELADGNNTDAQIYALAQAPV